MQEKTHSEIIEDLYATNREVERIIHCRTCFFRFPYEESNATVESWVEKEGYVMVGWDVDPRDWEQSPEKKSQEIARIVIEESCTGSIVILHDGASHDPTGQGSRLRTLEALPEIIRGLREKGLEPALVSDVIGVCPWL